MVRNNHNVSFVYVLLSDEVPSLFYVNLIVLKRCFFFKIRLVFGMRPRPNERTGGSCRFVRTSRKTRVILGKIRNLPILRVYLRSAEQNIHFSLSRRK